MFAHYDNLLRLFPSPNGESVLCIITKSSTRTLWLREFANAQRALDILCPDIISDEVAADARAHIVSGLSYVTAAFLDPESDSDLRLARYELVES